jgi:hypothetical protein
MLQFLDWVASRPRTYAEAMDAWRTSCPRLSVWEDALLAGLIQLGAAGVAEVALTAARPVDPTPTSPAAGAEPIRAQCT